MAAESRGAGRTIAWMVRRMVAGGLILLAGSDDTLVAAESRNESDPAGFLAQLSGEWSVELSARLGPGQDPVRRQSRESARMLGAQWLVAEGTGEVAGRPFTSILTLGYDDHHRHFVGTYIDSMQGYMWQYTGTLDASGRVLTLETEGPILGDRTRMTRYREIIEVTDDGGRSMRSLILGPDGEWFEFAHAGYDRLR